MIDEWEKVYPHKKEDMKGQNPHYFIKAEEDQIKRERAKNLRQALNDQVNQKDKIKRRQNQIDRLHNSVDRLETFAEKANRIETKRLKDR